MGHLIKHEVTCNFGGCSSVEQYEHDEIVNCAIEFVHWPTDWVFVTRGITYKDRYCPLHPVTVGLEGQITVSEEPDVEMGQLFHNSLIRFTDK